MPVLRTEVVAHRSSRRYAEKWVNDFADTAGDQEWWDGQQGHPVHVVYSVVNCHQSGGFDIVSTVTSREV